MSIGQLLANFLLPIISAFFVIYSIPTLRYRAIKNTNQVLFFKCILAGFLLLFTCQLIIELASVTFRFLSGLPEPISCIFQKLERICTFIWHGIVDFISSATGSSFPNANILTLILSIFLATYFKLIESNGKYKKYILPANEYLSKKMYSWEQNSLRKNSGIMRRTLYSSCDKEMPVLITLKSRKVYIGYVIEVPVYETLSSRHSLNILPIATGFRDPDMLRYQETSNYAFYTYVTLDILRELDKGKTHEELLEEIDSFEDVFVPNNRGEDEKVVSKLTASQALDLAENFYLCLFWDEIESVCLWIDHLDIPLSNQKNNVQPKL